MFNPVGKLDLLGVAFCFFLLCHALLSVILPSGDRKKFALESVTNIMLLGSSENKIVYCLATVRKTQSF